MPLLLKDKLISFSLYGNQKIYNYGALENAKLVPKLYPGWECVIYFRSDCDTKVIKKLSKINHVKLINMDQSTITPRMWRFIPAFEKGYIVIIRDTDSRLNIKEKVAVDEWLESDKDVHIMRDYETHVNKIQVGMFGCRNGILNDYKELFYRMSNIENIKDPINDDENIMSNYFYPKILNNTFVHASYNKYEKWAKDFPETDYKGFVGEIIHNIEKPNLFQRLRMLAYKNKIILKNKLSGL